MPSEQENKSCKEKGKSTHLIVGNGKPHSDWEEFQTNVGTFIRRKYKSYEEYLEHQKEYLNLEFERFKNEEEAMYHLLSKVFKNEPLVEHGMSVLCLGARLGGEVRAFRDCGCFAVGLDLNPGPLNKFVVHGDFHEIQFASESVDIIFTNSLDHMLEPQKVITEIKRVLKPNGYLFLVISGADQQGPGGHESFWWEANHPEYFYQLFESEGFELIKKYKTDLKAKIENLYILRKKEK